ncbi:TIGR03084 family protein [Actinopolyspora mzabensis]|uniref:TIGR03084 family protein n=1 Tax=Actinopolyspora mzabensis TaxID=995066 RepID=A0A1G8Y340_ACTMZ|nr:TIGR03084 family metal-binding protein [Actinopolyspora mzabensis]SDJ97242.1 TIGR03084 family protein [Actinopolyspora mzabensis]
MSDLNDALEALHEESERVDLLVADLERSEWDRPTPAPRWTIAHQIAHLAFIFNLAGVSASDEKTFNTIAESAGNDMNAAINAALHQYLGETPGDTLQLWRRERDFALHALSETVPERPLPWLVRPIPPEVLARAGIMELFGHGQDIADALGTKREATDRLRYLVEFAVLTWEFGYQSRGLTPPDVEFRFEITGVSGDLWTFGPERAAQRISGPAEDFCLLVTRRRHPADLALSAEGAEARHWLEIAQAYRGPAGQGRSPGQFATSH